MNLFWIVTRNIAYKTIKDPVFYTVKRRDVLENINNQVTPMIVQPLLTTGAFPVEAQRLAYQNTVKLRITSYN